MQFFGKLSQEKNGVGSIIGVIFVTLIILSGFAFYALGLNTTEHYNEMQETMNEFDWNRDREELVIVGVRITPTNKLNITVTNRGPVQSRLVWLGIFNKTATPENQKYYALDEQINPAETLNIVSDFAITRGKKYVIQLVTELGNTIEHKFYPASEVRCLLTLIVAPPTAYQGNNVSVLLTVTHNDTEVDTIQSLTVSLQTTPTGLVEVEESPSSLSASSLTKGDSVFFRWVYNATNIGIVTFNATYDQAPTGTYVLAPLKILFAPENEPARIGNITMTGPSSTPRNTLTTYTVRVTDANNTGITTPLFLSIYGNGSNVIIYTPPAGHGQSGAGGGVWWGWVDLDSDGQFTFQFRTTSGSQTVTLYVQVGDLVGQKAVVIT